MEEMSFESIEDSRVGLAATTLIGVRVLQRMETVVLHLPVLSQKDWSEPSTTSARARFNKGSTSSLTCL